MPKFDRAFAAIVEDLAASGLLDHTLVIAMSEFGRTPRINTNLGRDHYPRAFSAAVFGGGFKAGYAHGATDATGEEVAQASLTIPDFNATLALALGLPIDQVVFSPSQRPFRLASPQQSGADVAARIDVEAERLGHRLPVAIP